MQNQEVKAFPVPARIHYENKTVTVEAGLRMPDSQAIYREVLGCSALDFVGVCTDQLSDTPFMLLGTPDATGFTAAKPLEVKPDSRWRYIGGSLDLV